VRGRSTDRLSKALTNGQIAMLCMIGEHDPARLSADKRRDLERLLADGYADPANRPTGGPDPAFRLTAKGSTFLSQRGAGLNEA
jgi:hypothetical protein